MTLQILLLLLLLVLNAVLRASRDAKVPKRYSKKIEKKKKIRPKNVLINKKSSLYFSSELLITRSRELSVHFDLQQPLGMKDH